MGMRARVGRWLRQIGERLDPENVAARPETTGAALPAGNPKLPAIDSQDDGPAAGLDTTPSVPWQGVRERALSKSLLTLRSEAVYSLGALHAAHLAAAAVFDDRRLAVALAQRSGEAVDDEVLSKLAEAASIWHRDSASLGIALTAIGTAQVPDLTLAEALQVDEEEEAALEAMVEGYQIELQRQILEEAES
ncbi:hypothetical protein [Cyanobium sp. NIES-981]|uniref:hypothetical protein n=1 Tax=Cyanobium sp. NIES-981 TaxID=1851505 RepID=UPI0007DDCBFD|nr:hypothetical protein [Cyanobium sp. NIES-981]SBO42751.1 conserved protein of unknown function [Cyanobium sp. NIES-981]